MSSTVKIEPFSFGEGSFESNIQLDSEQLPGAIKKEETQETKPETKPDTTESKETSPEEVVREVLKTGAYELTPELPSEEEIAQVEKTDKSAISQTYKAATELLIKEGIWKDFDGKDDLEYDDDVFQNLWKAQADNAANEVLKEKKSAIGDIGNALMEFTENGGTVDQFLENYNQQLDIASIDISDESGQEKVISEFYESIGKSKEWIKKQINRLKDEGDPEAFKEEALDCKTKLEAEVESQRAEMIEQQKAYAENRKIEIDNFNKAVLKANAEDDTMADREKKELQKFAFEHKYKDKNGNLHSELSVKWSEINSDPKKYQKFLKFVKNFETFEEKKVTEKKVAKEQFGFLKTGQTTFENVNSQEPVKQKTTAPAPFKFNLK